MNRSFVLVFTLTCCATAGCDLQFNRDAELENAFAAVIHDEIQRNPQNVERFQDPAIFLTIDGKNPSPEFLKRFDGAKIPVKEGSEGGEGLSYSIETWKWITNDELEIFTSFHCGLKCGGSSRYHLIRMNSSWMVKDRQWITAE